MSRTIYFITHPDVVIDRNVPVPRWPLSERGRERMKQLLRRDWVRQLGALYCSTEQKAIDGAVVLSDATRLPVSQWEELGENDRSATGFLPKAEFEATADEFFAHSDRSVRGWERAIDAQARVVRAVEKILATTPGTAPIAIVAHGGVGALLLCHVKRCPISRAEDQPGGSGGNYFVFRAPPFELAHGWRAIDGPGN